jgi:hypothetical protein
VTFDGLLSKRPEAVRCRRPGRRPEALSSFLGAPLRASTINSGGLRSASGLYSRPWCRIFGICPVSPCVLEVRPCGSRGAHSTTHGPLIALLSLTLDWSRCLAVMKSSMKLTMTKTIGRPAPTAASAAMATQPDIGDMPPLFGACHKSTPRISPTPPDVQNVIACYLRVGT